MSRVFQNALVIGGLWGFVEVALTYITGSAPVSDVAEIFFVPVLASLLYHLALRAAFQMRPFPLALRPSRVVGAGERRLAAPDCMRSTGYPGEQRNLMASEDPRIVIARTQMLKEVTLRAFRGPGPAPPLSEDARERLRALGYLW